MLKHTNHIKKNFLCTFCVLFFSLPALWCKDIPHGYGGISLGMGLDETKDALKKNSEFCYNGDRDVSLLPGENRILIETDASSYGEAAFLQRCWFQFYNEKLYIMTINLNVNRVDHYSVYSTLCKKYGEPSEFSPERAVWKDNGVTMSLERPLSIKYIDTNTQESLMQKSLVEKSASERTRDIFLDSL